jgi:CRP-like cAMP-binding protein
MSSQVRSRTMPAASIARSNRFPLGEYLEAYGTVQSFHQRSFIYTPSQSAQTLYLLQAGQVSLQLVSSSGRALTIQVVEGGQLFGLSTLAGGPTYDSFAEVTRKAIVLALSRADLDKVLREQPTLSLLLIEAVGRYRLRVSRRLEEVAFKSVPARLASLLLDMADDVPDTPDARLPRRTHQQLADMINAYRETVTKVMNQFRAEQLLDVDRSGIVLLNLPGLRELAQN